MASLLTIEEMMAIPRLPQTQAPLEDQLQTLYAVANQLGLYDAADFIQKTVLQTRKEKVVMEQHRFTVKHNGVTLMETLITTEKRQWPAMAIHMADTICDKQESAPEGDTFELDLHEDAKPLIRDEARRKAGYVIYWR